MGQPYTCEHCGAVRPWEEVLYVTSSFGLTGRYLCRATCAIALWPCPIRIVLHEEIPPRIAERLRSVHVLERLIAWFGVYSKQRVADFAVHVFHRRDSETVPWMQLWDRHAGQKPVEPYSYRGWCDTAFSRIVLLVDEHTETPDSAEWLLYHELAHLACSNARMIDHAMEAENKTEGRTTYEWKDDAGHEADSEERLVNRVATAYMGGREYARPWWRPRVVALGRGDEILPDPHAPPVAPAPPRKRRRRRAAR